MPTTRINGVKIDLGSMTDMALWTLRSTVVARQHRGDRDLRAIDQEIGHRAYTESEPLLPVFTD